MLNPRLDRLPDYPFDRLRALLNPVLETISVVNPLSYVVEGMRGALFDSAALGSVWAGFAAGIGSVVFTCALAVWAMRSRLRS